MSDLLVIHEGPVARLVLNRPDRRNALSLALLRALAGALDHLELATEVRVVVLAGAGPAFSAGHDLGELESMSPAARLELFETCSTVMARLARLPQPVIARVHGVATAAGCQLVASCDLAVASDSATFATPGVKIGLFCSTPAVPLVRSIGRKRALEMLLTGAPIDARTAADWGLVNRVVPSGALDGALEDLVRAIVGASAETVAAGKRTFHRQADLPIHEAYATASAAMAEDSASPSAREGIRAFLEKRAPRWPSS